MPEKILVVDDDPRVLSTFTRHLRLKGHTVITAMRGEEALAVYNRERPSIVFADVRIPPPNGIEVLKSIRQKSPDAEVILITGHGDMELAIAALREGASDFIPKPIAPDILTNALRHACERLSLKRELYAAQEQLTAYTTDLEARVEERTRELRAANEKLRELDRIKTRFIADISHELRTPLTTIHLLLNLLQEGQPDKRATYIHNLNLQTNQLIQVVTDILAYAKLELERNEITLIPTDLNLVTSTVIQKNQQKIKAQGLTLTYEPEEELPAVLGDKEYLDLGITTMLENAINYTCEGHIWVRTYHDHEERRVYVEIEDTGRGISPQDMPHIFDRFYRGQNVGSLNVPGTGLGLTLLKEIIDMHQGEIEVESELGHGTTFRISLQVETCAPRG
ncbi:MAG: response regulator [Chloroflexi bacterium]|jgi:signal transduction histidine kinase|nr:response regulator [Chloroflexota bacterium]